jgi:hypothetical protein
MNGFISHIIQHHLQTESTIQPRLPGRFESFHAAQNQGGMDMVESDGFSTSPNQKINNPENNLIEKPISKNQIPPVDSGNLSDEIKPKGGLFSYPQLETMNANNSNPFEVYTADQAARRSMADRTIDSDERVRRNLITDINSNIFVRENTNLSDRNGNLLNEPVRPKSPSSLVFEKNRRSSANQQAVFFENPGQKAEPTIKVSIGRIEVRAIVTPQAVKKETHTTQNPGMSLDDYLKKRNDKK